MGPDVGPAGARVAVGAQHRSDGVVLEAGREQIRRRVAAGVGDEDDWAVVALAGGVGRITRRDREPVGVGGSGLHRLRDRRLPLPQIEAGQHGGRRVRVADGQDERAGGELGRLGLHRSGGEQLEQPFRGPDVAAAVAAHVEDQAVVGEQVEQARDLADELVGVTDEERVEP